MITTPSRSALSLLSTAIMGSVGLASKSFLRLFVRLQVNNLEALLDTINNRPKDTPLVTVANHTSTLDDPVMFGILPLGTLFNAERMRWALGAEEILFTNGFFSWFFGGGKVLAIRRGDGVMQPNVDRAVKLMNEGQWVHIFPEGKVVPDSTQLKTRLKWGVSRLILESERAPLLIPIIHQGFEQIKPLDTWRVRLFKPLTINIGDPIDTTDLRNRLINSNLTLNEQRSQATTFVASHMATLYRAHDKI